MKNLHCFAVTERVDAPHAWPGSRRTRSGACNPALCHKTRLLLLQARQHRWPRCEESPHRCGAGRLRRHSIIQEASHGSTEAHQRHGSTTPSGSVLQLQRRVWPVWRHGVVRSELLHAAAPLLQAVGLVLAVRLRLPRGGIVGVPGSSAENRHYRGAVGRLAQLDAALSAHAATQPHR